MSDHYHRAEAMARAERLDELEAEIKRLRAALQDAPEDWLKADSERWALAYPEEPAFHDES
ncbi:MAG: hypothetical protein M3O70_18795 [Actinomycetota bacterium]|nr:hypothetical protein [Actinomycetota bacterium]